MVSHVESPVKTMRGTIRKSLRESLCEVGLERPVNGARSSHSDSHCQSHECDRRRVESASSLNSFESGASPLLKVNVNSSSPPRLAHPETGHSKAPKAADSEPLEQAAGPIAIEKDRKPFKRSEQQRPQQRHRQLPCENRRYRQESRRRERGSLSEVLARSVSRSTSHSYSASASGSRSLLNSSNRRLMASRPDCARRKAESTAEKSGVSIRILDYRSATPLLQEQRLQEQGLQEQGLLDQRLQEQRLQEQRLREQRPQGSVCAPTTYGSGVNVRRSQPCGLSDGGDRRWAPMGSSGGVSVGTNFSPINRQLPCCKSMWESMRPVGHDVRKTGCGRCRCLDWTNELSEIDFRRSHHSNHNRLHKETYEEHFGLRKSCSRPDSRHCSQPLDYISDVAHRACERPEVSDASSDTLKSFSHRILWLTGLLVVQSLSSVILKAFQPLILEHPVVILFLTMLIGAGGNAGSQSAVLVIRALALQDFGLRANGRAHTLSTFVCRELYNGLKLAVCLTLLASCRVYAAHATLAENAAISGAMFMIVLSAILIGVATPFTLHKMKLDPAHAGAAIQVITDVLGCVLTCVVSSIILRAFVPHKTGHPLFNAHKDEALMLKDRSFYFN